MQAVYILREDPIRSPHVVAPHLPGFAVVKIGYANTPEVRRAAFQIGNPRRLVLDAVWDEQMAVVYEHELHTKYNDYRIGGEWFAIPNAEYDILKNVPSLDVAVA